MTEYEWITEHVDKHGDIQDVRHHTSAKEAIEDSQDGPVEGCVKVDIGLVRDGNNGRSWAYVKDGKLSQEFQDAYDRFECRTPKRFLKEWEKAQ